MIERGLFEVKMGTLEMTFSSEYNRGTLNGGERLRTSLGRTSMRRLIGILLLGTLLSVIFVSPTGSASSSPQTPIVDPLEVIEFYSYDRSQPLLAKLTLKSENQWYRRYELTYKSEGDTVYAAYFEPKMSGKIPAVIGIHGMFSEDEDQFWHVADFAAKRGFAVLMPSLPYHHRRSKGFQVISGQKMVVAPPLAVRDNFRRAVIDMRRALDWLISRDNVDPERIYITGASLGGMVSMLTHKADPRFKGGVFLVAGGGFRDILVHSDNPVVKNFRLLSKIGIADIAEAADTLTLVDPAALPDIWPRPVLMLNGTLDVIFPINEVLRAAETFHDAKLVWAKSSHFYPVSGGQYIIADFISQLAGVPLESTLSSDGVVFRETVLSPIPGDDRLWIDLTASSTSQGMADGIYGTGRFGIHLVNRVTPTILVPRVLWEAYRHRLEEVPASIFVIESVASGDLAFALSYIRFLERGHGGVYVLQQAQGSVGVEDGIDNRPGKLPACVTWLSPLDVEITWSLSSQMDRSGFRGTDILSTLKLPSENVNDVTRYLRDRIRVSDIEPIPSLIYDTATDIRWEDPCL